MKRNIPFFLSYFNHYDKNGEGKAEDNIHIRSLILLAKIHTHTHNGWGKMLQENCCALSPLPSTYRSSYAQENSRHWLWQACFHLTSTQLLNLRGCFNFANVIFEIAFNSIDFFWWRRRRIRKKKNRFTYLFASFHSVHIFCNWNFIHLTCASDCVCTRVYVCLCMWAGNARIWWFGWFA